MLSVSLLRGGGRWGVAQACNYRSILDAIASLLEAQQPELVMVPIGQEHCDEAELLRGKSSLERRTHRPGGPDKSPK